MTVEPKKLFVTAEEKERANNVNILEYLHSIGEPLKSQGNNFYRHEHHDSLVINAKKNYFSWNSKGVSGNAVTYLMNVHNVSFQHAVKQINNDLGEKDLSAYQAPAQVYPDTFKYDVKEVAGSEYAYNYLVHDRKIDPKVVQQCMQADLIKEDSYKNVVFKWKDKGELIGANLQGTREIPEEKRMHADRPYFKKVLPTTEEATFSGFNLTRGYPEKLYFFESPIDLLSYYSLNKMNLTNSRLMSMDGLKEKNVIKTIVNTLKELKGNGRALRGVTLCVDNDKAGHEFVAKMNGLGLKLKGKEGQTLEFGVDMPKLPKVQEKWDWNNELKAVTAATLKKKVTNEIEL
jgi:DNA primase